MGESPTSTEGTAPKKGHSACDVCSVKKESCPAWTYFRERYEEEDLGDFILETWEHVGDGWFVRLEPDPRLVDLSSIGKRCCG